MIRTAIVDDDDEIRDILRDVLDAEQDIAVAATYSSGQRAVDALRRTRVDVAVVDLEMPGIDGVETTRRLRALDTPPSVLILTAFDALDRAVEALDAGASAFLLKSLRPAELPAVLREVAAGRTVLAPAIASGVFARATARTARPDPLEGLTAREREIAREVGRGLSNNEIARALHISSASAKTFVTRLLDKLGYQNRTQLAIAAHHAGLLDD